MDIRYFIATRIIEHMGEQKKIYFVFKSPDRGSCTLHFDKRCVGEIENIDDESQIPIIKSKGYTIESFLEEEEILLL